MKTCKREIKIALAGNPNVGKSTIFNALTGQKQHTGNWPGKTVSVAKGTYRRGDTNYVITDTPGTYSLFARSAEEEVTRDCICFGGSDVCVVVCDATCLERNLTLVYQIAEAAERVVVCVNLIDEAARRGISVDTSALSKMLGVPAIAISARKKSAAAAVIDAVDRALEGPATCVRIDYGEKIEKKIERICCSEEMKGEKEKRRRFFALRMLDGNADICKGIKRPPEAVTEFEGDDGERIAASVVLCAERAAVAATRRGFVKKEDRDRKIDKILTGRILAYPLMLLLFAGIFWLTAKGANYPSALLSSALDALKEILRRSLTSLGVSGWPLSLIVDGAFGVSATVVSVMLPPMAIFFPLFTLLEDFGYLPRIAYNLDKPFCKCRACGKQALTMCMGLGCNAVGVEGCRIIDSPRERLLAILTNSFMPCNGRLPTIFALCAMFFATLFGGRYAVLITPAVLLSVLVLCISVTLLVTRLLSYTLLSGEPSSFIIELPPYRRPAFLRIVVRSVFDRTLFVLGRAVAVAAPMGVLIWIFANVSVSGQSLLWYFCRLFEPLGGLMGLDGVILAAFVLGLPANEIVLPIILMAYSSLSQIGDVPTLEATRQILTQNGWTLLTAINTVLFSLMHWPCSTTLITIKKETGSVKWTVLAALIPTACGVVACMFTTLVYRLFFA